MRENCAFKGGFNAYSALYTLKLFLLYEKIRIYSYNLF